MKPTRLILVLCLLALCASPVLAAENPSWGADPDPLATLLLDDYASYEGYDTSSFYEAFEVESVGGCSNGQIRELQAWCSQKAGVMTLSGSGDCTSKGIHYCNADSGGNVTDYSCAISCS